MNDLIFKLKPDGSFEPYNPEFELTNGSFNTVNLTLQVPTTMLTNETGYTNVVKTSAIIKGNTGEKRQSMAYELTYQSTTNGVAEYSALLPAEFTMFKTVNKYEFASSANITLFFNLSVVNTSAGTIIRNLSSIPAPIKLTAGIFLDSPVIEAGAADILQGQINKNAQNIETNSNEIASVKEDYVKKETGYDFVYGSDSYGNVKIPTSYSIIKSTIAMRDARGRLTASGPNGESYYGGGSQYLIPLGYAEQYYAKKTDLSGVTPPMKTSELTNDSGFITNTVNNLLNYYLKSETYTKAEVLALIGQIKTISLQVVQTLPTTGESNVIYLVPASQSQQNNIHNEFIYVNGAWEQIGSTAIDLSDYAKLTDLPTKLSDLINDEGFISVSNLSSIANSAYGTWERGGKIALYSSTLDNIENRNNSYRPITPQNYDIAVKEALSNNEKAIQQGVANAQWLEEDKANARALLNCASKTEVDELYALTDGALAIQETEDRYTQRLTAGGLNVVDMSTANLKSVTGETVNCKNLINTEAVSEYDADTDYMTFSATLGMDNHLNFAEPIPFTTLFPTLTVGQTVTISGYVRIYSGFQTFALYCSDVTFLSGTITITEEILQKDVFGFYINYNTQPGTTSTVSVRVQVELGTTATDYQRYFKGLKHSYFKGLKSVYDNAEDSAELTQPVETGLGVTIDCKGKVVQRQYLEYSFDGNTPVNTVTERNGFVQIQIFDMETSIAPDWNLDRYKAICSRSELYEQKEQPPVFEAREWFYVEVDAIYIQILSSRLADKTVEGAKAYFAQELANGNPYIFRYICLSASTEDVELNNSYTAYSGGSETVIQGETDNSIFCAINTLTQEYITKIGGATNEG